MGAPLHDGQVQETPPDPDTPASPPPPITSAAVPTGGTPAVTVKIVRERRRRRKPDEEPRPDDTVKESPDRAIEQLADTLVAGPESMPIVDPESWDRYEILRLLGRGGMGSVYEARDRRLGRHVAIKFIDSVNRLTTRRFLQEARAQARMDHPNVCKVLEVGEVEGKAYIAMQLIRGVALAQAARSLALDDKVRLMKTVTEAVHAAHRLGIIHRDIKPGNIMVEAVEGAEEPGAARPVLMDFGLAREASETKGLTESGAVMGTPAYMPPEQARGDVRSIDPRSDVYSLGATLYDLLAGSPPFTDESAVNILLKVLAQDPVPLRVRDPSIPQTLATIVGKCLNKEPHQRYASAADLADDLGRFLNRERVLARRLSLPTRLYWRARRNRAMAFAIAALVLSLLAFAGYGVRTVIVDARNEAIARRRAELGQKLGQAVKELEWLVRSAYLVPLHDTGPEKAGVRARMAAIEADMRSFGDLGAGLDHYALGRGYLALGEWDPARAELSQAEALGVREPELDYALGRVLGELYSRALADARRSGDKSYFEKQKQEIEREYLAPALVHLERCRGLENLPTSYLEGLIHFYRGRYDEALESARIARGKISWLYEAEELQGEVFMARALDGKDRGDNDQAERDFAQAVAHYEQAAEIGRSDHRLYEALAETWIRQEEMDLFRGRDPGSKLEQALSAADKALEAAPAESRGHTKKAFAYYFRAQYADRHGAPGEEVEQLFRAQIDAGKQAIAAHPADAYAHEIVGIACTRLAVRSLGLGQPAQPLLDQAYVHLEEAIRLNPRFPWAYNDYGLARGYAGYGKKLRNEDPEEWFTKAIETTRKAIEIDDQYTIAYNNTSMWLTELAEWKADHGEDPEKAVAEAVQAADRAIEINPRNPLPYANAGLAVTKVASYRLDTGQDGREPALLAIARYKAVLAIDPNFVFAQRELGRAYHLLASHERALGLDPRPSLDAGLGALEQCYRIEPGSAECKAVEAQLRAELAESERQGNQAFLGTLEQARKLASEAAQKMSDRADLWLVVGQICLQHAEALLASGQPSVALGPVVEEGLRAVEHALTRAPGTPRALAVEGALYLCKAQIDPAQATAALERARASLSRALSGNPLLKRRYEKAAAEVERRMKGP
jgi:tRNA A-37 threonylcarbamoyl transferase component Bud32